MPGTLDPPHRIIEFETIDSTNAEALRLIAAGERGPVWILAGRQEAGRGRSGRSWTSEPGNLFATFLTVLPGNPPRAYQIALVTGVAVAHAIRSLVPAMPPGQLRLKWPNDVLIGRAKAGGILVESTQVKGGDLAMAVGIGLNLISHPAEEARLTANLTAFGTVPGPLAVLSALDFQLSHWLTVWSGGQGFANIREAWLALSGAKGERLVVNSGAGFVEGTYQGIDQDGALILADDTGHHRIYSYGDVSLAGPPN